jgi:hypothetical protein
VSEEEAQVYSEAVRRGATLVAVNTSEDKVEHAIDIMSRHGVVDIEERVETWRREGWSGARPRARRRRNLGADPERITHVAAEQTGRGRSTEGGAKVFTW